MSMPMPNDRRTEIYLRQSRRKQLTPRQQRRIEHKQARIERLTGQRSRSRGPGR